MTKRNALVLIFGLILSAGTLAAQTMAVPANLQAAIFKKIFGFDKTLQSKGRIEVAVIYGDAAAKDAIIAAFNELGISAIPLEADQAAQGLGSATIVYVAPGATAPRHLCTKNRILSVSGISSLVESGQVSIGIALEGGKPRILINKARLSGEGQELADEVLGMARVIS